MPFIQPSKQDSFSHIHKTGIIICLNKISGKNLRYRDFRNDYQNARIVNRSNSITFSLWNLMYAACTCRFADSYAHPLVTSSIDRMIDESTQWRFSISRTYF
jgi:hypothetical protein